MFLCMYELQFALFTVESRLHSWLRTNWVWNQETGRVLLSTERFRPLLTVLWRNNQFSQWFLSKRDRCDVHHLCTTQWVLEEALVEPLVMVQLLKLPQSSHSNGRFKTSWNREYFLERFKDWWNNQRLPKSKRHIGLLVGVCARHKLRSRFS